MRPWPMLLVPALAAIACGREPARTSGAGSSEPAGAAPAAPITKGCSLTPVVTKLAMPKRLVAIGDLHGDLAGTRAALRTAGAIDDKDHWIGGDLVVVQTGDVLDRGDDEQAIMDLIFKLEGEAKQAGGAMIMLVGNHERMNAGGDYRYVTRGGFADFDDITGLDLSQLGRVPEGAKHRVAALRPGGLYAKKLAQHAVIAIVGDTVFSHAGVLPAWVSRIDTVNQEARCWLDGQAGDASAQTPALSDDTSPVWTRVYGVDPVDCSVARDALAKLGVRRQVVGHTVQAKGINSACDDTIWRIDVGLAKLYNGPIEVLELRPDAPPKVLHGERLQ